MSVYVYIYAYVYTCMQAYMYKRTKYICIYVYKRMYPRFKPDLP